MRFTFDWYKKTTKRLARASPGARHRRHRCPVHRGGGDVENTGFEVGLSWNDNIGRDFRYGMNVNFSYNKNEVTRIANPEGVIHGDKAVLSKLFNEFYRAEVGQPIGYFWGYKTAGVFQNQGDIDAWAAAGNGFGTSDPAPGRPDVCRCQPRRQD